MRLVYRLLFLFAVEDRDLLHPAEVTKEQRELYAGGYSTVRLRDRAVRGRYFDQHTDLWQGLLVVFRGLERGAEPLGLPALGGLFNSDQCPHLIGSVLSKRAPIGCRALPGVRAIGQRADAGQPR